MAIDTIDTSSPADGVAPKRGLSFRAIAISAFLLLLIGIAGGGWAMNRWLTDKNAATVTKVADAPGGGAVMAAGEPASGGQVPLVVTPVDGADALAARVADLEQRLSRITLEAASA